MPVALRKCPKRIPNLCHAPSPCVVRRSHPLDGSQHLYSDEPATLLAGVEATVNTLRPIPSPLPGARAAGAGPGEERNRRGGTRYL